MNDWIENAEVNHIGGTLPSNYSSIQHTYDIARDQRNHITASNGSVFFVFDWTPIFISCWIFVDPSLSSEKDTVRNH